MTARKFNCVQGCSDCCIYREYYPNVAFGKIGVLLLPDEKEKMGALARDNGVNVKIIPRLAVGRQSPETIIAYQMMGKNTDGDLCPFLDTESGARSPHGGFACRIYDDRPLACRAYPVLGNAGKEANLDEHCQFCKKLSTTIASLSSVQQEVGALERIKNAVRKGESQNLWRYATGTGNPDDKGRLLPEGWVREL